MLQRNVSPKFKQEKTSWKEEVHSAVAANSKMNSFTISIRSLRELAEKEAKLVQCALRDMENNLIDPKYILELTKSIHGTGEKSVSEYINRNTEILLNEYASVVRKQVIQNMKKQIKDMNEKITHDAEKLEGDILNFLELIESSYKTASDSFKKVVDLAKKNYEQVEDINENNDKLFALKDEVQKLEQQLLECLMCSAFLDTLYPTKYHGQRICTPENFLKSFGPTCSHDESTLIQRQVLEDLLNSGEPLTSVEVHIETAEVIKIIDRLRDSNLSLVHNSNMSKGSSKFETKELEDAKNSMDEELKIWDNRIADTEKEIENAKETWEKLKKQVSDLDDDKTQIEENTRRENEKKKIADIYKLCTGSSAKDVDLTLMRTAIDYCIEDLLHEMNKYPRSKIKELLKVLEAEKKLSERKAEEALRAQRLKQRLQKAVAPSTKKKI